jgi:hypothetical protein
MPPSSSGQDTRLIPVLGTRLVHNVGSNPTGGIIFVAPIAQRLEQETHNFLAGGSNPSRRIKNIYKCVVPVAQLSRAALF